MVKFRNGPFKEGIDNKVFIIPAIIVVSLIGEVLNFFPSLQIFHF